MRIAQLASLYERVPVLATFLVRACSVGIWRLECQETARTRKVARTAGNCWVAYYVSINCREAA